MKDGDFEAEDKLIDKDLADAIEWLKRAREEYLIILASDLGGAVKSTSFSQIGGGMPSIYSPGHGFAVGEKVSFPLGPQRKAVTMVVTKVTEYSMTVEDLLKPLELAETLPKCPNRGPQGNIEAWKRRGRKGK